jgi:uncharacterized protein YdhG (YjbR/CyaY superfamily)
MIITRAKITTMPKSDFKNVDDYIKAQPTAVQGILHCVRSTIRKAIPDAEEAISYKMPAYKLNGTTVIYFAVAKEHYSLYLATNPLLAEFKYELARYKLSTGTISFPLSEHVPVKLIERIARFRAQNLMKTKKTPTPVKR